LSCIVNTSFNIHEEPIVRTPAEAITAFRKAQLDYLAIGNYLVPSPQVGEEVQATRTDTASS